MIIIKVGDKFPETCEYCPFFVNHLGIPTYCTAGGEYTEEEIEAEEDGDLDMYYRGCLSKRPRNCPLLEIYNEVTKVINEAPTVETFTPEGGKA